MTQPRPRQAAVASAWLLPSLLVANLFLAAFIGIASLPLMDVDEGAFAEATREMVASGDWLVTTLNGAPRHDKPMLTYWLQGPLVALAGPELWAFRLPSVIAAGLWVWVLLRFLIKQRDRETAYAAAFLLTNLVAFAVMARLATAEALINLLLTLAMLDGYRFLQRPSRSLGRRIFLWSALGFMTKGPMAVGFPLLVLGCLAVAQHRTGRLRQLASLPSGWAIWLLIVIPWHLTLYLSGSAGFFQDFYLHHNLTRFLEPLHAVTPWWLYLALLPLLLLPFTGGLAAAVHSARSFRSDTLVGFAWCWIAVVMLLISFSATRITHYGVYALTPLSVLLALNRERLGWGTMIPALLMLGVWAVLPGLLTAIAPVLEDGYTRALVSEALAQAAGHEQPLAVAALGVGLVIAATVRRPAWQRLIGLSVLGSGVVVLAVLPLVMETWRGPVREAAAIADDYPNRELVGFAIQAPSLSVYRDRVMPPARPKAGDLVLTRIDRLPALSAIAPDIPIHALFARGGMLLLAYGWQPPPDPASR